MATDIAPPPLKVEPPSPAADRYDEFIEKRLHETRRQVKGVDVIAGLITLGIGLLGYLLVAVMIDQWIVRGGLSFWGRFFLLACLTGGIAYYLMRYVLPPLLGRVNPVFAAATIERSRPSLKNT